MKRIISRIALITFVTAGLATACSEDSGVDPGPLPIPEYENLTQKDHVLLNLSRAYNEMNINEFKRLLANEFNFFFSQTDIDSEFVPPGGVSWGRAAEEIATSNMFSRVPSKDEGFVIDAIALRLDYTPGDDVWIKDAGAPGNHEGEDWFERTVTYNMTIIAGDETFVSTDIRAGFKIKQVDAGGGNMVWAIVAWKDDIGLFLSVHTPGVSLESKFGASTHSSTWGAMKSLFRE